jgi:hypothetical protein
MVVKAAQKTSRRVLRAIVDVVDEHPHETTTHTSSCSRMLSVIKLELQCLKEMSFTQLRFLSG